MNPERRPESSMLYRRELTGLALLAAIYLTGDTDPQAAFAGVKLARESDPEFESLIEQYFFMENHRLIKDLPYIDPQVGGVWLPDMSGNQTSSTSTFLRVQPRIDTSKGLKHALTVITADYKGRVSQNAQNPGGWRILAIAKGDRVREMGAVFSSEAHELESTHDANVSFDVTAITRSGMFIRKRAPHGIRTL